MSSTRARVASAIASASVMFIGWQAATHHGQAAAVVPVSITSATTSTQTSGQSKDQSGETSTTASPATAAAGSGPTGTYTGTTEFHRYGSVTVTVTVKDGVITDITADAQANDHHSEQINSYAIPALREEVLAANSAEVSTISGATFTSDAYLTSLQAALDQA